MMQTVSKLVYGLIKSYESANANPFGGEVFPLVAPLDAEYPFCVYKVRKESQFSKAGIHDLYADVVIIGTDYDVVCGLADDLEEHIESHEAFIYQSTNSGVNPEKPAEIQIAIKFNIKMTK